jgi:hypothetical protein
VLATDVVRQDRLGSRCPAVVDVKPTEHARDLDRLGQVDVQDRFRRHPLPNALVRSALVEVQLVLAENRAKMFLVEHQHVVEQLSSYAAHEALRDCVHIRRANRRPDHLRADALGRAVERRTELVVAIPQQDGRSVPVQVALRGCCAVHAWVGWRVAAT